MQTLSNRLPSAKYLTAQSLFLEVNGNRDKRLHAYKRKQQHDKRHTLRLEQELEADLSFYCESQREVERLLDEINLLKMRLVKQELEAKLDRAIIHDFIRGQRLDLELAHHFKEQLRPRLGNPATKVA